MTSSNASDRTAVDLDARGLKCPWPALRLARSMRQSARVVIVADDPIAPVEIASLAKDQGWVIEEMQTQLGPGWRISR